MNAFVAATDYDWFRFLSEQPELDEVNFWYPKPWGGRFRVLGDRQPLPVTPHRRILPKGIK